MPLLILAILIGIPVMEIAVFVEVGSEIGALNTIILTVLTAIAGMAMLRSQGLSVLMQAQNSLDEGRAPVHEIFSGIMLALAGLFLLIPGFVTDFSGFLLFMPPLRNFLARKFAESGRFSGVKGSHYHSHYQGKNRQGTTTIIDGDYTVVDDTDAAQPTDIEPDKIGKPDPDSPWGNGKP